MRRGAVLLALVVLLAGSGSAAVMNGNTDTLPPGCDAVNGWANVTVHAGRPYAEMFNGKTFTYDNRSFAFERCQKVTVTFVNNDSVRHQFMVHGLPESVYPMGMFAVEVTGPGRDTGTFILPSYRETLLVHCGVPQHMQKGMKAQLAIDGGDGNLANIPGLTGSFDAYAYPAEPLPLVPAGILAATGLLLGIFGAAVYRRTGR